MDDLPWPFRSTEMLASGAISEHRMRSKFVQAYPGVYVPRGAQLTAGQRAQAAWLWSERRGVVAGLSAAALLGSKWVDGALPAELVHNNHRAPARMRVHEDVLDADETTTVLNLPVTTPARTAFDLGRRLSVDPAIERLDALMNATGLCVAEIEAVAVRHKGARGIVRLREVLDLVDGGAESPYETRTRLLIVRTGFPRPETQICIRNRFGDFIARVDMGWKEHKVGIEFDGAQHWSDARQRSRDVDRRAQLAAEGWLIIHVTSELLRHRAGTIIARVEEALSSRTVTRFSGRFAS